MGYCNLCFFLGSFGLRFGFAILLRFFFLFLSIQIQKACVRRPVRRRGRRGIPSSSNRRSPSSSAGDMPKCTQQGAAARRGYGRITASIAWPACLVHGLRPVVIPMPAKSCPDGESSLASLASMAIRYLVRDVQCPPSADRRAYSMHISSERRPKNEKSSVALQEENLDAAGTHKIGSDMPTRAEQFIPASYTTPPFCFFIRTKNRRQEARLYLPSSQHPQLLFDARCRYY